MDFINKMIFHRHCTSFISPALIREYHYYIYEIGTDSKIFVIYYITRALVQLGIFKGKFPMIPSKLNTSLRSKNKVLENIDLKGFLTEHWLIAFCFTFS